jgi:hypothetical protein
LSKRQQLDPGQYAMQQFGKPRIEHLKNRLSLAEA